MRWLVILGSVAVSGCGAFCGQPSCAQVVMVKVQDSSGAALTDFTATLTGPSASPVSATCPADPACGPGTVALRPNDTGSQLLEVTAGGRSASKSFTPMATPTKDSGGCPGCPVANVDITVQ